MDVRSRSLVRPLFAGTAYVFGLSMIVGAALACGDDVSAGSDAGHDAAQMDGGAAGAHAGEDRDASVPPSDAAHADAGPEDAAGGDAAPSDAALWDAAASDAAPRDAAPATDGGGDAAVAMPDAASEDAGPCNDPSFDLAFNTPDPTRAIVNPNEVYLLGTLGEGACYLDALGHWSAPDQPLAGFECGASQFQIRPADGRIVYAHQYGSMANYGLRVFECDGCTYSHPQDLYPEQPLANDPVIPTPPCNAQSPFSGFRMSPEGTTIHTCRENTSRWYDATGTIVLDGATPLSFGSQGRILLQDAIHALPSGERTPIVGLPVGMHVARRANEDGFWIAVLISQMPDVIELWQVGYDGSAELQGTYPPPPSIAGPTSLVGDRNELDAQGQLYQIVTRTTPFLDLVIRRSIGGTSEVIYDEATHPTLRLHISSLVSGPGPEVDPVIDRVWGGEITEPACQDPTERWNYADAEPEPPEILEPFTSSAPGAGLACGNGACGAGQACCERFTSSAQPDVVDDWKCSANPDDLLSEANSCSFYGVISYCDEPGDCADYPSGPGDPPVCCFVRTNSRHNRMCTTASTCAAAAATVYGYTNIPRFMGMIACQTDADCALAGSGAHCVWDPRVAGSGRTWVGRCDAAIEPPDGTRVFAASVRCGDTECDRIDGHVCCHEGDLVMAKADPLNMEPPRCTRSCGSGDTGSLDYYVASSECDEPSDCVNPSRATPGDPFECCMEVSALGPSGRQCQRRSDCKVVACLRDADCARIHPESKCRPERTSTGAGIARPDVRTCQSP